MLHLKIDRTFVDEHGTRWVIDYKTATVDGGDVEVFLDSERDRYAGQLGRYAVLLFDWTADRSARDSTSRC